MNAMGNIKVLTKTGINMKVFWASIEYKYNGNPMKGGFVSMETTMKKTTSPIVREYKIGDITYIVKAVVKDGAKEDAVTKVHRLIQNDLRGKKVTNNFEPA